MHVCACVRGFVYRNYIVFHVWSHDHTWILQLQWDLLGLMTPAVRPSCTGLHSKNATVRRLMEGEAHTQCSHSRTLTHPLTSRSHMQHLQNNCFTPIISLDETCEANRNWHWNPTDRPVLNGRSFDSILISLSINLSIYVSIYICIYVYIYVSVYLSIYICIYILTHTHINR